MAEFDTYGTQAAYGGLALNVAESVAASIRQRIDQKGSFSFSFSRRDTKPLDSELCIVSFDWGVMDSIWLGRFSAETPTGRRRLTFDNYVSLTDLPTSESGVPDNVESPLDLIFGIGEGKLAPQDWRNVINWIKTKRPEIASRIDELEALRLEASRPIEESGQRIVAEQWEATGAAMDFSGFARAQYLPPLDNKILNRGKPFVLNFDGARTLEEDVIPHEMRNVCGWEWLTDCKGGIVKLTRKGRKGEPAHELTVINTNKKSLEICLGVDLIFHQSAFDSCILVQYKRLKKSGMDWWFDLNEEQICKQLAAIEKIKQKWKIEAEMPELHEYRIGNECFFVKFIQDEVSDAQSKSLFSGWYVPVEYLQLLKKKETGNGDRGGCRLTEQNVQRWFSNSDFAPLVSSGWIGTCGKATRSINEMVNASLEGNRALVFAVAERTFK